MSLSTIDHKPKPLRIETPHTARYLTFGCYRRQHLFRHKPLCQLFLDTLTLFSEKESISIWAYVIMSNHIHLLVYANDSVHLRKRLAALKSRFASKALEWLRLHQPSTFETLQHEEKGKKKYLFWQRGGGYDRALWTVEEINKSIKYIHANPVRAGIVADAVTYEWSSAKEWEHEAFTIIDPDTYYTTVNR